MTGGTTMHQAIIFSLCSLLAVTDSFGTDRGAKLQFDRPHQRTLGLLLNSGSVRMCLLLSQSKQIQFHAANDVEKEGKGR